MEDFKIRASATGKIMGKKGLGKTGESYVKQWHKENIIYNRRKEFTSKYTDKGNIMEDYSIDFVALELGYGMLQKNEDFFENDFIKGTPDIVLEDTIIDVKNSWDFSTFPLYEETIPNMDYYWQGQSYMALTGKENYKLIYILSDTPAHLIEKEAYFWAKNNGYEKLNDEILDKFTRRMTYPNIDNKYKIKVFEFQRNEKEIDLIISRVKECRDIITNFKY